jgi:hypothetical protein
MSVMYPYQHDGRWLRRTAVFVRHYGVLLLSVAAVYGVYVALRDNSVESGHVIDTRLLIAMGFGFALAAVVMLLFTREWSLRAVGQFLTYVGDAALWGGVGAARVGWTHPITPGELQIIRATFIVAIVALVLGLIWWLFQWGRTRWRRRNGWDGTNRRIAERRKDWPPHPPMSPG